jgi:hypothetical protein
MTAYSGEPGQKFTCPPNDLVASCRCVITFVNGTKGSQDVEVRYINKEIPQWIINASYNQRQPFLLVQFLVLLDLPMQGTKGSQDVEVRYMYSIIAKEREMI